ncbi:cation:proton antiporter [Vallicoccus soli]|uniref:Sodium:proton antiporter n=1 Tax=Vallicoccus soli TaxID=2339232 RepID=A0A3A3Z1L8_9ACTN|nr:sodium:proton antiporter [Vallicoccus soli]RJK97145.1 sodium:proton antiporter [Vallicoccus soli]
MGTLEVLLLLLLAAALLPALAERTGLPAPVLTTCAGAVLALVPAVPRLEVDPELVLPVLLPPLIFAAASRVSTRALRRDAAALVSLAVLLVLVTTVAVALAVRLVDPTLPLAVAVLLGAVVSPPDPVAASSVAGRVGLPRRLLDHLEGEGLFNDATALVVFQAALTVAAGGALTLGGTARLVLLSTVAGALLGLALGRLASALLERLDDPRAEVLLTVLLPYGAFVPIDLLGGSGVVAVIAAGLYVGQFGAGSLSPAGRLQGGAVWGALELAATGVAFGLVGAEVVQVLQDRPPGGTQLAAAAVVCATAAAARLLWVAPAGLLLRRAGRLQGGVWRESVVISWAGMRGVVTVATVLALPEDLPGRSTVQVCALAVVLVTLLGQGPTLAPVVRALGVTGEDDVAAEVERLRGEAARAALARLDDLVAEGRVETGEAERVRRAYGWRRDARRAAADGDPRLERHAEVLRALHDAERDVVLERRRSGSAPDAVTSVVLRDIEARALRGR